MQSDYEKARARVEQKKSFYLQLVSYLFILIVGGIVFTNPLTPLLAVVKFWFYWIMFACGVSMMLRYFRLFGLPEIVEDLLSVFSNWEEKAIQKEMKRLQAAQREEENPAPEEKLNLREMQTLKPNAIEDSDLV